MTKRDILRDVRERCLQSARLTDDLKRHGLAIDEVKITAFDMRTGERFGEIQKGRSRRVEIFVDEHMKPYRYAVAL